MSYRTAKNLGLCTLFLILLFVALVAYRQSRDATLTSRMLVEQYMPAQETLTEINHLLRTANHTFLEYADRERIPPLEVLTPLDRLQDTLMDLEEALSRPIPATDAAEEALAVARSSFVAYLAQEAALATGDAADAAAVSVREALGTVRRHLRQVLQPLLPDERRPDLVGAVRTCANLLRTAEARFRAYVNRDRTDIREILGPVERALGLLGDLRGYRIANEAATTLLDDLVQRLHGYRAGLLNYQDDEAHDTSESILETLRLLQTTLAKA
jgi:hypothetical protein